MDQHQIRFRRLVIFRRIIALLLALDGLLLVYADGQDNKPLMALAIAIIVLLVVLIFLFWKCPKCGEFLGHQAIVHCPYCGIRLRA